MRLRVLIQLDLFHEAHKIIQMILDGQKLPSIQVAGRYQTSHSDSIPSKFKVKYFLNLNILSHYLIFSHNILIILKILHQITI